MLLLQRNHDKPPYSSLARRLECSPHPCLEGVVDGHALIVGRPALLADWAMHFTGELNAAPPHRGRTRSAAIGWDGHAAAVFVVADTVKDSSAEAVASLMALELRLRPSAETCAPSASARAVAGRSLVADD